MTLRVGINGFGRIGRNVLRAIIESQREDIKVVAINNRSSIQVCAHLLKYDSIHGRFPFDVSTNENIITVDKNYLRPLDVNTLLGNASKARRELKWKPKTKLF